MPSSGVWRRVDVVDWTDVSEDRTSDPTYCSSMGRLLIGLVLQLPAQAGSSLADFSTLKMEAIQSSETSVQSTTSTRHHTPEDGILHSHRRENLKSYNP
jgi:hypothetical protein